MRKTEALLPALVPGLVWIATACGALLPASARADRPAVHGMLLFASDHATYAAHLPMFHAPHDYQAIFRVELPEDPASHAALASLAAHRARGEKLFTLVPEVVDLTQVISGARSTLAVAIYAGHFKQGGENLGPARMQVEQVVYAHKLDAAAPASEQEQEHYFVFGSPGEYFAVHLIAGKPSFDATYAVSAPYTLRMTFCRTRLCGNEPVRVPATGLAFPLTLTEAKAPANPDGSPAIPGTGQTLGEPGAPLVDIQNVIYAEHEDLAD